MFIVVKNPPTENNQIMPKDIEKVEVEEEHNQSSLLNDSPLLGQKHVHVISERGPLMFKKGKRGD